MDFRPRPYVPDDLPLLTSLMQAAWERRTAQMTLHVGDLYWRMRDKDYEQCLRLWPDEHGRLAAFGEWTESENQCVLDFQLHPAHSADGTSDRVLLWAETESASRPLMTYAAEADMALISRLDSSGYQRQEHWYNNHTRSLEIMPDVPGSPAGYVVRHLTGAGEIEARVQGHRAGWQSEKMTVAKYERLMDTPGYRPELDCVVVAPDGSFAATCNCWLDECSGAGLFEPVSTALAHRRKGLGQILVSFGLRQLRSLGARSAWVASDSGNPAATRLYERCGLSVVRRDYDYVRQTPRLPL